MALQPVEPGVPTQIAASMPSSSRKPSSMALGLLRTTTTVPKFSLAIERSDSSLGVSSR